MRDLILFSLSFLSLAGALHGQDRSSLTLDNVDSYLVNKENAIPGVMDGAKKIIAWHNGQKVATNIAVLYFHGYSSSRQEISPVPQLVADALNANIFYTRFTGHGIKDGGIAFKGVTFEDWINDAEEAMDIARLLGKKVIIIAHSNGAVMAMHLMKNYPDEVMAGLFVAPNFKPKNPAAPLLAYNWGYKLATFIYKDSLYGSVDGDGYVAPEGLFPNVWSNTQHLDATKALSIGVQRLKGYSLENMQVPLFIVASELDKVVDTNYTKKVFLKYGTHYKVPKELRLENTTNTIGEHTITGDYKAPQTSKPFAKAMVAFVKNLPQYNSNASPEVDIS